MTSTDPDELWQVIDLLNGRLDDTWKRRAACRGEATESYFSDGGTTSCGSCTVRTECLAEAVAAPDQHGIWGGRSEEERIELRRALEDAGVLRRAGDSVVWDERAGAAPTRPPAVRPERTSPPDLPQLPTRASLIEVGSGEEQDAAPGPCSAGTDLKGVVADAALSSRWCKIATLPPDCKLPEGGVDQGVETVARRRTDGHIDVYARTTNEEATR